MARTAKVGGTKKRVLDGLGIFALIVALLFYLVPFVLVILNSFKQKRDIIRNPFSLVTEKGMTFENYVTAFDKMDYLRSFGNSLFVTGLSTLIVIILSAMCAYYIVRAKNKLANGFYSLMIASMIIPFQAIMIPLVSIYGAQLGMMNHKGTLIFMHVGFAMSMSVFMYSGFVKSGVPIALEEAAYLDGCTKWQTFTKVMMPLTKASMAALTIFTAVFAYADLMWPLIANTDLNMMTLSAGLSTLRGQFTTNYPVLMAGSVLAMVPMVILYLVFQKQFIEGIAMTGGK